MATAARRVKRSWQNKQSRRRSFAHLPGSISKTLRSEFFFFNVNTLGTKDCKAENMAIERADIEKAMAPHSSTLAWKIPWMEKPGGYSPWGR